MLDVSLKDRMCSEILYTVLGIQSVAEVVMHGRLSEMIWASGA